MPPRHLLTLIALASLAGPAEANDPRDMEVGWFEYSTPAGLELRVWTAVPRVVRPDTPVVIVMHGMSRDAERYRNNWVQPASRFGMIVAAPEFDAERFPGSRGYNLGNRFDAEDEPAPKEAWTFTAIESLFDDVKRRTGTKVVQYDLYGHSAGGQFVHRFLYFAANSRVRLAVAANAGWYTMPDDSPFPYGLRDADVTREALAGALRQPLVVLLGEADNDPEHPSLRRTPEALAQGAHRLARGKRFFELGRAAAEKTGVDFGWRLQTVPNVAHSNAGMAPAAAQIMAKTR